MNVNAQEFMSIVMHLVCSSTMLVLNKLCAMYFEKEFLLSCCKCYFLSGFVHHNFVWGSVCRRLCLCLYLCLCLCLCLCMCMYMCVCVRASKSFLACACVKSVIIVHECAMKVHCVSVCHESASECNPCASECHPF